MTSHHLMAAGSTVLAAPGDTTGITSWLNQNVVGLVILAIGIVIMSKAHSRDHKGALGTVSIVLIGLAVLGLSTGTRAADVGTWLSSTIFGA